MRPKNRNSNVSQVDFTETTRITITCKHCGSDQVIKWGTKRGVQQYWCKVCQRKFVANNALPGMRYTPQSIGSALNMFYEGLSLNAIQRQMNHDCGSIPSDATIYEWVVRFTRQALTGLQQMRPIRTGNLWAADETVLKVAGSKTKEGADNTIWFWDVIDEQTKFLLASHMSQRRTIKDAEGLFREAASRVDKAPRFIITDKLGAYIEGIERVFGADTTHIQSQGMARSTHNNVIERFHGTVKQRTKVMRGMKNKDTSLLVMGGWLIHYNFFRPHESLKGETPGKVAKATYPWRNWREVVTHGYIPTERRSTTRVPTPSK